MNFFGSMNHFFYFLSLVSSDVYEKMSLYKKISSRSFSSFTNFCQYCSKSLDMSLKGENFSQYSSVSNSASHSNALIDPKSNMENTATGKNNSDPTLNSEISIFHCGHSFHISCLEIMESGHDSMCPICNSSSSSTPKIFKSPPSKAKTNAKNLKNSSLVKQIKHKQHQKQQASLGSIDLSEINLNDLSMSPPKSKYSPDDSARSSESPPPPSTSTSETSQSGRNYNFSLSESQIKALKSIRTRSSNMSPFLNISANQSQTYVSNNKYNSMNTMLEKQSKLQLAPANLSKFIE